MSSGLVAYYAFDEGLGTSANDSSGTGNTGTLLSGPVWVPGKVGPGALHFSGGADYVDIGDKNIVQGVNALTISLWFKPDTGTATTDRNLILHSPVDKKSTMVFWISRSGATGKLSFSVVNAKGTRATAQGLARFNNTSWNHALGVYNGAKVFLYLNGVLQTSVSLTGSTINNTGSLQIACGDFAGAVDEVYIWNRALSAQEIARVYSQGQNGLSLLNSPPSVFAGTNQVITLPAAATLSGTASDDGLPAGSTLTTVWSLVSGPGTVTFGNPAALATTATFSTAGTYVLRLSASDTELTATSQLTITVNPEPDITPPVISALAATPTFTNAVISWTTDEAADSQVEYGPTAAYGSVVPLDPALVTNHLQTITGLQPATTYHYRVYSRDASLNQALSGDNTFTTTAFPLSPGLVAYYAFNEGQGTTANDSSGNHNTGTLINSPTWISGKVGSGALHFKGGTDSVTFGDRNIVQGVNALTISLWFKPDTGTATIDRNLILHLPVAGISTTTFWIARSTATGKLCFSVMNASGTQVTAQGLAPFNDTSWNQAIGVYDGASVSVYLNGVFQTSVPLTGSTTNTAGALRLSNGSFAGAMDEVYLWNRALSALEIAQAYSQGQNGSSLVTPVNCPPAVLAGTNQVITLPAAASLFGTASDDGLPAGSLTTVWSLVSGPGTVTFGNPAALATTATFSTAGAYVLRLTASDTQLTATSQLTITVNPALDTTPPAIRAVAATPALTNAVISWTTDEAADSQVEYGPTAAYGSVAPLDPALVTNHLQTITGIEPATTYHYRVYSRDASLNQTLSGDSTFATQGPAAGCEDSTFSFVCWSDSYQDVGFKRVIQEMWDLDPDIRMLIANGDETPIQTFRNDIDSYLADHRNCGETEFPFFPAPGNHAYQSDPTFAWFQDTYGNNWAADAAQSRLACQMPGMTNFKRGPLQVLTINGLVDVPPATIYSFDYKNAHFVFLNDFELGDPTSTNWNDRYFGVWDLNGPTIQDPATSQLDWLREDLGQTTKPLKFVFSHVGLVAPWYQLNIGLAPYGCGCWSEHQPVDSTGPTPFHTAELAQVLATYNVTAIFRGHDHCPSRDLVDANNQKVFERSYLDAYNDPYRPYGIPATWQAYEGPGKVWQIDDGSMYDKFGFYVIIRITDSLVTFSTYRFDTVTPGTTYLWDTFSVPVPAANGP